MALEGVIYAMQSEIGIDGDTMFTKNWAEADGGEKERETWIVLKTMLSTCLLYTSPSPRDATLSRMPSSA